MGNYQNDIMKYAVRDLDDNPYGKALEENAIANKQNLTENEKKEYQRLNFSPETRILLGARVGFICSYPGCNQATIGPKDDGMVILGEAAHIYGAVYKKDGTSRTPRPAPAGYNESDITKPNNDIWLCRHHHRLIDAIWNQKKHTAEELKKWKKEAEARQSHNLEIKEPDFVIKYINSQISVSKGIDTTEFGNSEWCLLAYLMETESNMHYHNARFFEPDTDGNCFDSNYQAWLSENSIDQRTSGMSFSNYDESDYKKLYGICNNLAGLVYINRLEIGYGKAYSEFCEDLLNADENAIERIKRELAKI